MVGPSYVDTGPLDLKDQLEGTLPPASYCQPVSIGLA